MSTAGLGSCIICEKPDSPRCARCKSAFYCSKACQLIDWPVHGLLCGPFATFNTANRPTKDHFRAIVFLPNKYKPKFRWIYCKWHELEYGYRYQCPEASTLVGEGCRVEQAILQSNPVSNRQLDDGITISFRDTFLVDGSARNKGVLSIITTQPGDYHDWRGPITAYGKVGPGSSQTHCRDLDMNDFHHIADFFLSYGSLPPGIMSSAQSVAATPELCGMAILAVLGIAVLLFCYGAIRAIFALFDL
ncbi:hypothetical protein PG993_005876 [Apiospora rasikravindrae]|uniref:MYND-type domain-containing protein n=1 Tax=Apiospora rasikravindrae TaxID=990691 RepID=A0ABR1TBS5_9PEZI